MNREELVDILMKEFDRNGDGALSRGEFRDLVKYLIGEHGVRISSSIFEQFDRDHDNAIERDELLELIDEYWL
ncbi:MAG: EF-hand domain-containing protein [Wenzhouxiangella sp.]|nr:EF-hand domain-containing protein [Wenzhouxiangella sp.]